MRRRFSRERRSQDRNTRSVSQDCLPYRSKQKRNYVSLAENVADSFKVDKHSLFKIHGDIIHEGGDDI